MSAQDSIAKIRERVKARMAGSVEITKPVVPKPVAIKPVIKKEPVEVPVESKPVAKPEVPVVKKAEQPAEPVKPVKASIPVGEKTGVAELVSKIFSRFIDKLAESNTFSGALLAPGQHLMPKNCKFFHHESKDGFVVIESPPQCRTVLVSENHYFITLPYVIFMLEFERHNDRQYALVHNAVCFSNKPISSINQIVQAPPLSNIDGYEVCMGEMGSFSSLNELTDKFISDFWQTIFVGGFQEFNVGAKTIKSFEDWQNLTQTEPLTVLDADWGYPPDVGQFNSDIKLFDLLPKKYSKVSQDKVVELTHLSENLLKAELKNVLQEFGM